MKKTETLDSFAKIIIDLLHSDRWVTITCDGSMGEGKSAFTCELAKRTAKLLGTPFSYEGNMTFLRSELIKWVDGLDEKHTGQLPEYSVIIADELISLFYKRNWQENQQKDSIELMNKCRDRHLCLIGNIPTFWDLDVAIFSIVTFWVHIPKRGYAWVFQKDTNPFSADKWHRRDNEKNFRTIKNPYRCANFLCEIQFNDWSPEDKARYYEVRNMKRLGTEGQRIDGVRTKQMVQEHTRILKLITLAFKYGIPSEEIAAATGYTSAQVKYLSDPNQIGHWLLDGRPKYKY